MLPILLTNFDDSIKALVVGGGKVGLRRVKWLLSSGINAIDVISPSLAPNFERISYKIQHLSTSYKEQDLNRYNLIFACTDDTRVNELLAKDARACGVPINRADSPESSDFIVPASFKQGEVEIAISTGIPSYSKRLSNEIKSLLPQHTAEFTKALNHIRSRLKKSDIAKEKMKEVLKSFSNTNDYEAVINLARIINDLSERCTIDKILEMHSNMTK